MQEPIEDVDQKVIPSHVVEEQQGPVVERVTQVTETKSFGDEYRWTAVEITERETVVTERLVHKEEYAVSDQDTQKAEEGEVLDQDRDHAQRDQLQEVLLAGVEKTLEEPSQAELDQ